MNIEETVDLEEDNVDNSEEFEEEESEVVEESEDEESEESDDSSEESEESDDKSTNDDEEEESEVVVTIGEQEEDPTSNQEPPKDHKAWAKMGAANRKLKRQIRELEQKINANTTTENKIVELGKKPTLSDFDYDNEQYEEELDKWYERKVEVDKQKAKQKEEQTLQEKQWQDRLNNYSQAKDNLKVIDYEEAEFNVQETLSTTQQGMIIEGADNPALVVYALGKNPNKLKELSNIKQPVKFAFAVSKLETQLKVASKTRPTSKPEKKVQSTSGSSSPIDSTLDRLREEAAKTGDFTKVIRYKNQLKNRK